MPRRSALLPVLLASAALAAPPGPRVELTACLRFAPEVAFPDGGFLVQGKAESPGLTGETHAVFLLPQAEGQAGPGGEGPRTVLVGADGRFETRLGNPPPDGFRVSLSRLAPVAKARVETAALDRKLSLAVAGSEPTRWEGLDFERLGDARIRVGVLRGPQPRAGASVRSVYELEGELDRRAFEAAAGSSTDLVPGTAYFKRSPALLVVARPEGGAVDPDAPYYGLAMFPELFGVPIHGPPAPRYRVTAYAMDYETRAEAAFASLVR